MMSRPLRTACALFLLLALLGPATGPAAQENITYQTPPQAIVDIVDAPRTPRLSLGPDRQNLLLLEYPALPPLEEVAQPELRLAGERINPRTNGPSRGGYYSSMKLRTLDDRTEYPITGLPSPVRITDIEWSPDGSRVAFACTIEDRIELWLLDLAARTARRLSERPLNAVFGSPFTWFSDSRTLLVRFLPDDRGEPPVKPRVPEGPNVQENLGAKAPARTYQDLLANPCDEQLFDYYGAAQTALVTVDGAVTPVGRTGVLVNTSPSPDGRYILAETIHRPYSYTVPAERFPRTIEVWDRAGATVYRVADLPLADRVPITFGSAPTGPRDVDWRADADAALFWVEALDGGDAAVVTDERDRLFLLPAPFTGEPAALLTLGFRYSGVQWGNDSLALVNETWWPTRTVRTWRLRPGRPEARAELIVDRSWEDRYQDPGAPMLDRSGRGTYVLATADTGTVIFRTGAGASPEGNQPFLDAFNVDTKETTRLFRSAAPYYEEPVDFLDIDRRLVLTRRESVDQPPNYFRRDLRHDDLMQITFFPHPTPQLRDVKKELVTYTRADGVQLSGKLYLPPRYDPKRDGPLPMLMWAYPEEFKSAGAAGQVTDSPYRFVRASWSSPLLWLALGYAVLDDPSMPIVGEGDAEPNDTYVEQLVASARAAVDEMVRRGVADRDRIAVGGHSYGAFMTANLLAHSDLFAAGIARSGAYNRTLTPFGFQSEERTFWEAPQTYFTMSPFMQADRINEPLLLIHGEADNNPGTYPMQSERFYAALKGQGATVCLVMLPHESHGYQARESVLHVLWEMTQWLDTYVKNRRLAEPGAVKSMSGAE